MRRSLLLVAVACAVAALTPAGASAASPACRARQVTAFTGCLAASRGTSQRVASTPTGASAPTGDPGAKLGRLADDTVPGRRAGAGLIALIWAMTLAGAATVAVLLRRESPPNAAPAKA